MKCPQCITEMYKSIGGIDICPGCGYGSLSVAQKAAERQKVIDEENRQREADAAPRSEVKGNWSLEICFRFRGSRSEGQHGVLFHNGKPVEPKQVGEVVDTDLGQMKYYRRPEDMKASFELTGWNYADVEKIRPSWSDPP